MYGKDLKRVRLLSQEEAIMVIAMLMEKSFPDDSKRQHEFLNVILND